MNMPAFRLMILILVYGLVSCGACVSTSTPEAPGIAVQGTPVETAGAGSTATAVSSTPLPTPARTVVQNTSPAPASSPVAITTTWIPWTSGKDTTDEPRIVLLSFVKEAKTYTIPDCGMRVAFPQAAGDPAYGIRQKVKKLILLTPEEIDDFQNTYSSPSGKYADTQQYIDPYMIGGTRCTGVPADPRWNFVRINATLIPRNARPGEYTIGINVRSHGEVIEQLWINQTFVIDEPVIFVRYIPLKVEEMDAFDSVDLVFSRRV
jgi:hypothetical protein